MLKLHKNSPPIEVDSAFGGLGIYNPRVFLECDYGHIDLSIIQSEHVDLHLKAKKLGFKFVIDPKMINSHYNTHNINRIRIVRICRTHPTLLVLRNFLLTKLNTK